MGVDSLIDPVLGLSMVTLQNSQFDHFLEHHIGKHEIITKLCLSQDV